MYAALVAFGGWLLRGLIKIAGPAVLQCLAFLGISFVTHKLTMDKLLPYVVSNMAGLPASIIATMGVLRVDQAIVMLLSAVAVRMAGKINLVKKS